MRLEPTPKRRRGRPNADSVEVSIRFSRELATRLDAWIAANSPAHPALRMRRPEAVRRLVEAQLATASE